jgi:hypothetical protein
MQPRNPYNVNGLYWLTDTILPSEKGVGGKATPTKRQFTNALYGKNFEFKCPKLGDNCTAKRGHNPILDNHHHCPHCGAIANLHFRGVICIGCDLCRFGYHYPAICDYSTE